MARSRTSARVGAVAVWGLTLLLALTAARVVALPEHCGGVTVQQKERAASDAVDWFARTQKADGTFLYRVDVTTGEELPGYSWVRHAGALLALEQAAHAGLGAARPVADRGWRALEPSIVWFGDRAAVVEGGRVTGGGTALALAALGERREATGQTDRDALMRAMARQLVLMSRPDGTVAETASGTDGAPDAGSVGRFTTGEAAFALARMERLMPGEGWGAPVRPILRYLALDKAVAEGFVPDMAEHWGAYALAEVVRWRDGAELTDVERAWARKQMGMLSSMIRYESQRSNSGVDRWLRGRTSVGSAVGTHGESMQGWVQVAAADPVLRPLGAGARDRLACNAGLLARRQVTPDEAARMPDPAAAAGTWTWFGITQVDDQQHSLSALLAADRLLDDDPPVDGPGVLPRRAPTPESAWLALGLVVVAVDPLRIARRTRRLPSAPVAAGSAGSAVAVAGLAAVGATVLDALDVSVPTAAVAAGAVVTLAAVLTLVGDWWRRGDATVAGDQADVDELAVDDAAGWSLAVVPVAVPVVLRPALLVLAMALGAGGRTGTVVLGAVAALGLALLVRPLAPGAPGRRAMVWRWAEQLTCIATVVLGVLLIVDGVYAV